MNPLPGPHILHPHDGQGEAIVFHRHVLQVASPRDPYKRFVAQHARFGLALHVLRRAHLDSKFRVVLLQGANFESLHALLDDLRKTSLLENQVTLEVNLSHVGALPVQGLPDVLRMRVQEGHHPFLALVAHDKGVVRRQPLSLYGYTEYIHFRPLTLI